jgi:hypothetical protein
MSGWVRRALFQNLSLKIVSLALAVLLYVVVRSDIATRERGRRTTSRGRPAATKKVKGRVPRPDVGSPAEELPSIDASLRPDGSPAPVPVPTSAPASSGP